MVTMKPKINRNGNPEESKGYDRCQTPPYPNPTKFLFLERLYRLGKPFALLLPVEIIGTQRAQHSMQRYGCELLLLNRRVNFEMPIKGTNGSSAQFPVLWFCWQLLPQPIVYGEIIQTKTNVI